MSIVSNFGVGPRDKAVEARDEALFVACMAYARKSSDPERRFEYLMAYLETFPTGSHNREVAEAIERSLDVLACTRDAGTLLARYRALRDEYLPPLSPVGVPLRGHASPTATRS